MARKETVIQFGEGGFLRGFADYFFQKMQDKGLFDGSVVIVQPIEKGMCSVLEQQGCEYNLFLRGIVKQIGFKSDIVYYERSERFAGESKYPLKKMLAFAFDGITSFSVKPIRLVTVVGFLVFLVSVAMIIYAIVQNCLGNTEAGWSSLMCSIWFLSGLQIMALGIVGEYIGKIYTEVKARPKYIIDKFINKQ